jgi:hypothetical protein
MVKYFQQIMVKIYTLVNIYRYRIKIYSLGQKDKFWSKNLAKKFGQKFWSNFGWMLLAMTLEFNELCFASNLHIGVQNFAYFREIYLYFISIELDFLSVTQLKVGATRFVHQSTQFQPQSYTIRGNF